MKEVDCGVRKGGRSWKVKFLESSRTTNKELTVNCNIDNYVRNNSIEFSR